MARPVIELARRLEPRPALIGISMGGRVAVEAALRAPEAFRSVIAIAPFLPWRRLRWAMPLAYAMSPWAAAKIPVEAAWPVLRWIADQLASQPMFAEDDVARAGVRMIYYASCPATRSAMVSAAREMALDPAFGPEGLWTRLPRLAVPASFVWGARDRLVPIDFARPVAMALPAARQLMLPCARPERAPRALPGRRGGGRPGRAARGIRRSRGPVAVLPGRGAGRRGPGPTSRARLTRRAPRALPARAALP
jgi:pimeloyl-ACP methyl ester carboxylesterase